MENHSDVTIPSVTDYTGSFASNSEVSYPKKFDVKPYLLSVGCLGVLDNAFVIVVVLFYTSMTKRLTGRLILNQSCLDLTASLAVIARQSNALVRGVDIPFRGVWAEMYCRFWLTGAVQWSFILGSTLNMVAMTLERYASVTFPIFHKRYLTKGVATPAIVLVWLVGPVFEFSWCGPSSEIINGFCWFMFFSGNARAFTAYGVTSVVIYYLVPLTLIIFCYSHMVYNLRRRGRRVLPAQPSADGGSKLSQLSSSQRNLLKTLFMVSASFVACWSWYEIVWLCISSGTMYHRMVKVLDYAQLFALLNLVINPFIYIFHYREFRQGLWKMKAKGLHPMTNSSI